MATTEFTHGTATATERLRALFVAGAQRAATVWTAVKNRREATQLLNWDDRMLSDIGLTRGDVRSAFSGTLADDPSYRLSESRRARRSARRTRWG